MAPNYNNAKIFGVRSNQIKGWFIGATTLRLCERMSQYRKHYRLYLGGKVAHDAIYEILKYDDAHIYLIEDFPCNSKEQLNARLAEYVSQNKTSLLLTDKKNRHRLPQSDTSDIETSSTSSYQSSSSEYTYSSESSYEEDTSSQSSSSSEDEPKRAEPLFSRPPNIMPKPRSIYLNIQHIAV